MMYAEAFELIGQRATALAQVEEIQQKMLQITRESGKEAAETYLYTAAIATLCGIA